ncbi:LacI family DNA-binding transcriptional regulator [Pseudactinotalea sp. HY158]|uniref:LacI family DNA-binding transcriptional regulator n=1 Tax=Pseudactinotalea sp. HY158 TaxID=2654547 RepID=UPI00129C7FB9|nr:LacI family DNA-binding transcriptional regulator [Pseudactinotalea sp. HY158]QGH69598.1 LacI family DNA-binding transcriptional regulator [Pseudactinotalea sp. HY158]
MARSVTLHDVARAAGVSLATASRVLNGSERKVAATYRDRVLAAARDLQYTPNLSAQAVARGRSNSIGLVVADIVDPYFAAIAAGAMSAADEADEAGLVVTISVTDRDPARELSTVHALRGHRPRALLLAGSRPTDPAADAALEAELRHFADTGGRVVLIAESTIDFPSVRLANHAGALDLGRALHGLGYRRAAVLTGPAGLITPSERARGFIDGFGPARIYREDFSRDGGHRAARRLLDDLDGTAERGPSDVDLVFAASDVMAVGAMTALREAGRAPGRDLGVAGFDDVATIRDITPALTTVRVPLEAMGSAAVTLALGEHERPDPVHIAGEVVLRESTPARRA